MNPASIESIFSIIRVLMLALTLSMMFQPRRLLPFSLCYFMMFQVYDVILNIVHLPVWSNPVIHVVINTLAVYVFTRTKLLKVLLGVALLIILAGIGEVIMLLGLNYFNLDFVAIKSSGEGLIMLNFTIILVLVLFYSAAIILWRLFIERLPVNNIYLFALIPISQLFAIIFIIAHIYHNQTVIGFLFALFLIVLFVVADIILFYAMLRIRKDDELKRQNELFASQLQLQFEHYETLVNNMDRVWMLRHDLANHLQTIQAYLNNQEIAVARNLINDYASELAEVKSAHYCDNKIIDALLLNKVDEAKQHLIHLHVDVTVPEQASIDNLDLCSIFSNLLDNAIAASKTIKNPSLAKLIHLISYYKSGYYIIQCRNHREINVGNSKKKRPFNIIQSDNIQRGLGLLILEDIAKKYKGECTIKQDDTNFEVTLLLENIGSQQ